MLREIGEIIQASRNALGLTQDQYGSKYSISGPAVFKFEKGYVRPSLGLWLAMARDFKLTERRAVLLWLRSKLPDKYRNYIEIQSVEKADLPAKNKAGNIDYSKFENKETIRAAAKKDKKLPHPLRELLNDDDIWASFKPTGHEVNMLRDIFGPLGHGTKVNYAEALRLIREFTHSF